MIDVGVIEHVRFVLAQYFPNGIRPASIIDQNRFRRYYEQVASTLLEDSFEFDKVLPAIGIVQEGKVFPRPSAHEGGWLEFLLGLMEQGNQLLWFSRVMELHADEMIRRGIASAEMLREVMVQSASDKFEIAENRFAPKDATLEVADVVSEMVVAAGVLVSESVLRKQLPYIDEGELHGVLKNSPAFLKNARDSYVVVDRIELDDCEVRAAIARVSTEIKANGYISLALFDFPESATLNDSRVESHVLRMVFFERHLAKDYGLKGQIVMPKGASLDSRIPLRLFCREKTEVMLDQVKSLCDEYNISLASGISVLHEEMVRVDAEKFVSPQLIAFDAAEIDQAIERHVDVRYPSLPSFMEFGDFPSVPGYLWNVYLLESFLRRASNIFGLMTLSDGNLEPVGMVFRFRKDEELMPRKFLKYCPKDSLDEWFVACLSRRLISAKKEPLADAVGEFLIRSGYILRRSTKFVNRVLGKMRQLLDSEESQN